MKKYYLQLYRCDPDPENQDNHVLIDELPFQPFLLESMTSVGIIELKDRMLSSKDVERVYKIQRLRNFLGVNLSGAAVIIDLLERIETLENEMDRERHV